MIYIFTALSFEAAPFIKSWDLKADDLLPGLRVYKGGDIILAVTGSGPLKAASAAAAVMAAYGFSEGDQVINAGICAGRETGELFIVNKVTDKASGRDYYPDMIYKTGLPERALVTLSEPATTIEGDLLCDMEGAAVFEAASLFTAPHRIMLLKIVSDSGDSSKVSRDYVTDLIASKAEKISEVTDLLRKVSGEERKVYNEDMELVSDLKCSEYMRADLRKLLIYADNSGRRGETDSFLEELRRDGRLPAGSRHEGKVILDEIRRRLI